MGEELLNRQDTATFLGQTFLWAGLSEDKLSLVANALVPLTFEPGERIIECNQPGSHLHVLVSGNVEVRVPSCDGEDSILLAVLPQGECFGEMSLLTGDPTSADVIAAEDCQTLALSRKDFKRLVGQNPTLLQDFVKVLAQRLRTADAVMGSSHQRQRELARFLAHADRDTPELIGSSLRKLRKSIEQQAQTEEPLYLWGEAGTGKELIARQIHSLSPRRDEIPFSAESAQVTESAWGDRLFGSYSGTAPSPDSPIILSYMEMAEKGTLVLRNIERLPLSIQAHLAEVLDNDAGPSSRPRLIATGTHDLEQLAAEGRFDQRLAKILARSQLQVPSLRDRKRDIPDLARHFLKKHAERLDRPVSGIDDEALSKLVCYEYVFGNVAELEKAIERAVILSDEPEIHAEVVFLAPPPPAQPTGFNWLRLPGTVVDFTIRKLPSAGRVSAALVFLYIFYDCFFGPAAPESNLGHSLVWTLWWPMLILSFFFLGRAWCAVCPMGQAGRYLQRLKQFKLRIPSWLKKHDATIVMAGFFGIVWMEEAVELRNSPRGTGLLLMAILLGALAMSVLFPRRSWCRHVCPLGAFAGVSASTSLVELRPTFDICSAKCAGHSCFKGEGHVEGCPMFNHVMFVDSNRDCVLCMQCVESCPNGSPQLNLRLPGRELWSQSDVWKESGPFIALLLGLLAGMSLIQAAEGWSGHWMTLLLNTHRFWLASLVLVITSGLTLLWAGWPFPTKGGPQTSRGLRTSWHAGTFIPLLLSGFIAYQLAYIPGIPWIHTGIRYAPAAGLDSGLEVSLLLLLRAVILMLGLIASGIVLWKVSDPRVEEGQAPSRKGGTLRAILFFWVALVLLLVVL